MTEYQVQTTNVPPVLRLIDGALFIEVIFGGGTIRAPIGDGSYFVSQVMEKLVTPALRAAYPRGDIKRDSGTNTVTYTYAHLASPND